MEDCLQTEDKEYWVAAMADELRNYELHKVFSEQMSKPEGVRATPTRWLPSKKLVNLRERQQDPQSNAYKLVASSNGELYE